MEEESQIFKVSYAIQLFSNQHAVFAQAVIILRIHVIFPALYIGFFFSLNIFLTVFTRFGPITNFSALLCFLLT